MAVITNRAWGDAIHRETRRTDWRSVMSLGIWLRAMRRAGWMDYWEQ